MVKKIEDTTTRFDRIHERDRRSDRVTDRQTNRNTCRHRMTAQAALALHRAAKVTNHRLRSSASNQEYGLVRV